MERKSFSDIKFLLKRYYWAAFNAGEITSLTHTDCLDDYSIDETLEEVELKAGAIGNEILEAIKDIYKDNQCSQTK